MLLYDWLCLFYTHTHTHTHTFQLGWDFRVNSTTIWYMSLSGSQLAFTMTIKVTSMTKFNVEKFNGWNNFNM
jgi:hypothetical protein